MNVQVKRLNPTSDKSFPKLMSTPKGYVVFFVEKCKGLCLANPSDCQDKIGEFGDSWTMTGFTDFEGSITLSND